MTGRFARALAWGMASCACLVLSSCGSDGTAGGSASGRRKAPLVVVEPVQRVDADFVRSYLVTLQPAQQANVLSRASGHVLAWHADRGDHVMRGQRLAAVERAELSAQQREAQARLESARASLENARANAVRVEGLAGKNYVSAQDADGARTAVRVAEAQVAEAEAALRSNSTRAGYADVLAPFDGFVLKRLVETGSLVGPGGPALFQVGSIGRVKAVATVPQSDFLRVAVGQPVSLVIDGLPGRTFPGKVMRFPPALDPVTRTVDVEVEFDNPDELLKPGMFGRTTVVVDRLQEAIVVPPRSVARRDSRGVAYVVRGGRACRVDLDLGRTLPDGRVEVLGGLSEGDALVVAGRDLLRDGMDVRTTPAASAETLAPGRDRP